MADLIKASMFIGNGASFGCGDEVWCTDEVMTYISKRSQRSYTVPDGFLHDYASVPRLLQIIVPKADGIGDRSYILHDWLVRNRVMLNISLVECHELFYEAMRCCGVSTRKAKVIWAAVYGFNWMCANEGIGEPDAALLRRVHPMMLRPT